MYLEYQLTEEDYIAAAALAARKRSWVTNLRYIRLAVVAIVLIIGAGSSLNRGKGVGASLFSLLILVFIIGALYFVRNWLFARTFRNDLNLQTRRRADFNERTVRFTTENSDSTTGWEIYTKFAENAKTFILFQKGSQLFIPIPKRDLNPLQIEELRMLMKQGIGRDTNRPASR